MQHSMLSMALLIVVTLLADAAFGQDSKAKKPGLPGPTTEIITDIPLDIGHLDGLKYVNKLFGLSFSIPATWIVENPNRREEIVQSSRKLLEKESPQLREQYEKSMSQSTTMLSLIRVPKGTPNNASFLLIAERISSPAIKNGVDALRAVQALMKGKDFVVEFQDDIRTERINGLDFGVVNVTVTSGPITLKQKIYVIVKYGYALEFFLTYVDDAHLTTYTTMMQSVKIK